MNLLLAAGLLLIVAIALSVGFYHLQQQWQTLQTQLNQQASRLRHYGVLSHELQRLKNDDLRRLQTASETLVDGGTELVKGIHMGIANIPFGVLEAIPATRHTSRLVRGIHDLTSNTVYGSIKGTNKAIGAGVRLGLETRGRHSSRSTTNNTETPSDND